MESDSVMPKLRDDYNPVKTVVLALNTTDWKQFALLPKAIYRNDNVLSPESPN